MIACSRSTYICLHFACISFIDRLKAAPVRFMLQVLREWFENPFDQFRKALVSICGMDQFQMILK